MNYVTMAGVIERPELVVRSLSRGAFMGMHGTVTAWENAPATGYNQGEIEPDVKGGCAMAKTLVLMRHGKAAARETWREDDALRPLTEGGTRALEESVPQSLALLGGAARDGVQVWASPAVRTVQTARIVAHALKTGEPRECEFLWRQDEEEFLAALEESDASCVVAVGHNPFVDDMTARLTGVRLPFFPGAAVALRLERRAASPKLSARLLWFVQGPKSGRFANLVALENVIARASDTVEMRLEAFFENEQEPETMHKLRVSIRTMRSLVAFIQPWQKESQNKAIQRDLRTVVRWTSRLRELDVLVGQAAELEGGSFELVEAIVQLRNEERDRVAKKLRSKQCRRLLGNARAHATGIEWRKGIAHEGIARKAVRARFEALLSDLECAMLALDIADAEATHDVRKDAKRVRYAAENFGMFLDEGAVAVAKRMVKMQDGLGAICDARVNVGIIDEFPRKKLSEAAALSLAALRERNEAVLSEALSAGWAGRAGGDAYGDAWSDRTDEGAQGAQPSQDADSSQAGQDVVAEEPVHDMGNDGSIRPIKAERSEEAQAGQMITDEAPNQ